MTPPPRFYKQRTDVNSCYSSDHLQLLILLIPNLVTCYNNSIKFSMLRWYGTWGKSFQFQNFLKFTNWILIVLRIFFLFQFYYLKVTNTWSPLARVATHQIQSCVLYSIQLQFVILLYLPLIFIWLWLLYWINWLCHKFHKLFY
jgi:hypothetical protein